MSEGYCPGIHKPICKGAKGCSSTPNLLHRLKRQGVPSDILSSLKQLPNVCPSEVRKLVFPKNCHYKSITNLAKKQSVETLKMSLNTTQTSLKRRDTETTNDDETDVNTPLKSLPFSFLRHEESQMVEEEWISIN